VTKSKHDLANIMISILVDFDKKSRFSISILRSSQQYFIMTLLTTYNNTNNNNKYRLQATSINLFHAARNMYKGTMQKLHSKLHSTAVNHASNKY